MTTAEILSELPGLSRQDRRRILDRILEIEDDSERATTLQRGDIDVPLFPTAADAPASHMTVDELIAAEQQALFGEDVERLRQSV